MRCDAERFSAGVVSGAITLVRSAVRRSYKKKHRMQQIGAMGARASVPAHASAAKLPSRLFWFFLQPNLFLVNMYDFVIFAQRFGYSRIQCNQFVDLERLDSIADPLERRDILHRFKLPFHVFEYLHDWTRVGSR